MPKKAVNENRVMTCMGACQKAAQAKAVLRAAVTAGNLSDEEREMLDLIGDAWEEKSNGRRSKKETANVESFGASVNKNESQELRK